MSVAAFYNEAKHLGNLFGVRGLFYGRKGHLGVDFKKHPAGTPVPSWTAGVVVDAGWSKNLGWLVIIRRSDGLFAGFCHLRSEPPVQVGDQIDVGDIVGLVGSTGRFSTGPHVHCTLEPTITIGTQNAIDPLPYIRAAVRTLKPRRSNMASLFFTKEGKRNLYALAGDSPGTDANWQEFYGQKLANALAGQHGNAAELTPSEWAEKKAQYRQPVRIAGGSGGSNAEVLAAIAKIPTAEENGKAARAEIVK